MRVYSKFQVVGWQKGEPDCGVVWCQVSAPSWHLDCNLSGVRHPAPVCWSALSVDLGGVRQLHSYCINPTRESDKMPLAGLLVFCRSKTKSRISHLPLAHLCDDTRLGLPTGWSRRWSSQVVQPMSVARGRLLPEHLPFVRCPAPHPRAPIP